MTKKEKTAATLRHKVRSSLRAQGFQLRRGQVTIADGTNKDALRRLHGLAVAHRLERGSALRAKEPLLIQHIADGREVDPVRIAPQLTVVHPDTEDELLFRYVSLHWSIPVSSGYGRRIRFLVRDGHTGKVMGIIGLGDPVFALHDRDEWIGWTQAHRQTRLRHVLDAYVLGAVPPYSRLLAGKLIAMLAVSSTVRRAFEAKYAPVPSRISGVSGDARVALITTTSALGRSSVYNRLQRGGRPLLHSVGYTKGSGEFHFSNGIYDAMKAFATEHTEPTSKHERWGSGFRSRREVVKKTLKELGLPLTWDYHGVQREIFVGPLARNTQAFLKGDTNKLAYYRQDARGLIKHYRERWLLPRASRDAAFREFRASEYLIWPKDSRS